MQGRGTYRKFCSFRALVRQRRQAGLGWILPLEGWQLLANQHHITLALGREALYALSSR